MLPGLISSIPEVWGQRTPSTFHAQKNLRAGDTRECLPRNGGWEVQTETKAIFCFCSFIHQVHSLNRPYCLAFRYLTASRIVTCLYLPFSGEGAPARDTAPFFSKAINKENSPSSSPPRSVSGGHQHAFLSQLLRASPAGCLWSG